MTSGNKCGHVIKKQRQVVYERIEYPYNPEWSLQRLDAGLFCSDECLLDYLTAKATDHTKGET